MTQRRREQQKRDMSVTKENAITLLNGHRAFSVPYFQRAYVWKEEQWERFLEDMEKITDDEKSYFMGFLILKVIDSSVVPSLNSIVDGQQRLTTLLIFSRVIGEINESHVGKIKFHATDKDIILEHNHNDDLIFNSIIENGTPSIDEQRVFSENQVLKCYNYFKDKNQLERIKNINFDTVIEKLFFICMFLKPADDEQQIFDTMNSLGVSLTTSELLKNLLFDKENQSLYDDTWKKTFEKDEEVRNFWDQNIAVGRSLRKHIDLLLQSFIVIQEAKLNKNTSQKVSETFKRYQEILKSDYSNEGAKEQFIKELMEYAQVYRNHIHPEAVAQPLDESLTTQRLNLIIFSIELTSIVPYVIYILKSVENENEQREIFKIIENYVMRRFIANESTKGYNKQFIQYIRGEVKTAEKLSKEVYKYEEPTTYYPNTEKIKEAFENGAFINKRAKIILFFLEHHLRTNKHSTELRSLASYQVEHVMPRDWKNWSADIPKDNQDEFREKRNNAILTLGNLTLLTGPLNSSLRNAKWIDKRDGTTKPKVLKGFNHYCKDIEIFSEYLKEDNWNEELISRRSSKLFEIAKKLWPYEPPTDS